MIMSLKFPSILLSFQFILNVPTHACDVALTKNIVTLVGRMME